MRQRQAEQHKEAEAKKQGSATPDVQPEHNGTGRTGVKDSTPAAVIEETASKEDDAKQGGPAATGQASDMPSDTSPQPANISAQANGLSHSQMPLRNSGNTAPDLQAISTIRPTQAKLTPTSSPDSRKKLNPTTDAFTPHSGLGSSIPFGISPKLLRPPQSGAKYSASRSTYVPPPMRTPSTASSFPDNAPVGPTGKNTREICEASFTDTEDTKWKFKINHQPACEKWKTIYENLKYIRETKEKPIVEWPPHWDNSRIQQPAHTPEWKKISEEHAAILW